MGSTGSSQFTAWPPSAPQWSGDVSNLPSMQCILTSSSFASRSHIPRPDLSSDQAAVSSCCLFDLCPRASPHSLPGTARVERGPSCWSLYSLAAFLLVSPQNKDSSLRTLCSHWHPNPTACLPPIRKRRREKWKRFKTDKESWKSLTCGLPVVCHLDPTLGWSLPHLCFVSQRPVASDDIPSTFPTPTKRTLGL